ncbi:hypothetical protein K1719_013913 [Acacia pycnantha]|nr:hypothetical protein K1719_013913 [Acacia pycnantha]
MLSYGFLRFIIMVVKVGWGDQSRLKAPRGNLKGSSEDSGGGWMDIQSLQTDETISWLEWVGLFKMVILSAFS